MFTEIPESLEDYFKILEGLYPSGKTNLPTAQPWYYQGLMKILARIHPDQAVKRLRFSCWEDLRRLYSVQLGRSHQASLDPNQTSHYQKVCGLGGESRELGQQPCTISSIEKRVEIIEKSIKKNEPILIIGDDDALSVALAKKGFKDLTILEIDEKIVKTLKAVLSNYPSTHATVVQQDIFKDTPAELYRSYSLITFDPWYSLDGVEAFSKCWMKINSRPDPIIILSFNLGALLADYERIFLWLSGMDYNVTDWYPLANTYPAPRSLRMTLKWAEGSATLLSGRKILPRNWQSLYLSSDLLVLKK